MKPAVAGHRAWWWTVGVLVVAVSLSASVRDAVAQVTPAAVISGVVVDQSGAVIRGAAIELTNSATRVIRRTDADAEGRFIFDLVRPGTYEISASAEGFATYKRQGITLDVNVPATLRVVLSVGSSADEVTVHGNVEMVDSRSATLRQVVSEAYIEELPLNGRNAASLIFMAPGTVAGKGTDAATYANTSETIAVSVNGTFGDQVSYKLDGATHQDSITNLNAAFPNPDALAEFSVETNNFDARYGGSGGAVVNIVTKSGTNVFHGTVFEYLRNGAMNARNFFAPTQDDLKRNQFGGTGGGPIRRDKLFFFGSYQGTIADNTTFGNTAFVPSAAMREGDFSSVSKAIVDPTTGRPFPANQIPQARISPISRAILQKVPITTDPTGKLLYAVPSRTRSHQLLLKSDSNVGAHQLSASVFHIDYRDPGWDGNGTLLNYKIGQHQTTTELKASDTYVVSSHLLNSLTVSGLILDSVQTRTAPFSMFDFGLVNVTAPDTQFRETGITVAGFSGWGSGGTQPPGEWIRDNIEIADMLTWVRGGHSVYTGVDITPYIRFDSTTGFQEEPVLNFNGSFTGNAMADFLLGRINTFTQTAGKAKFTRGHAVNAFVQDDWRIGPRVTVDLGLRWDPFVPYSDPVAQQVGGYVPGFQSARFPGAPIGLAFAGDTGFPSAGMHNDLGNVAPRIGGAFAAIQGAHATTIRGGWGRFYIQPFTRLYNNFVQNAPFSPSVTLFGADLADPYGSAGVGNPFPPFAPVHPTAGTAFVLPVQYQFFNPNWHLGHIDAWNVTLERQVVSNLVARVAYVETHGRDLQYFQELNPALYNPSATVGNTNARRPLAPEFASLIEMTNGGHSDYRALQLTAEKRLSAWGGFVAHYTWSRAVDNQSVDAQFTLSNPNPFVPAFNDGRSDFETPHNFSLWGIVTPSTPAAAPTWIRRSLDNWEVTGIWTWRSGTPFTVTSGQDRSLSGVGLDRADLVGDPVLGSDRSRNDTVNEFFNVNAFRANQPGTFGTAPRNLVRNPPFKNLDLSVQRSFSVGGRRRIQLRADVFNVTNAVHLNQPGANVNSPSTFGKITSAGEPRIVQLAARLEF